ncbi:hypothetical protein BJY59DRAFT_217905 [Rhodotorula toruloides]
MARTPFRSRSGLSGPQPTHTSLGKAPGSKWGTKRAKAGQRVRRKGVFPSSDEEGGTGKAKGFGRKLVSSDDEDAEAAGSKGAPPPPAPPRPAPSPPSRAPRPPAAALLAPIPPAGKTREMRETGSTGRSVTSGLGERGGKSGLQIRMHP